MATETAEAPVYLYETLAPLGEVWQDESLLSPPSSGYTIAEVGSQTMTQTVTEVATSTLTSTALSSRVVSSAAGIVEDTITEECEERVGANLVSPIDDLKYGVPTSDQDFQEDTDTFISERIVESAQVDATADHQTSSIKYEDFDFLSLDVDDSGDAILSKQADFTEEKVTISGIRTSAAQEAPPWARTGRSDGTWFRSPFLQLHQEIVDFCNFVAPTEEEKNLREAAVQRVSDVIQSIWPSCQVKVFGSFATGLFLPTSDCDVVILESGCQVPQDGLKAIAKSLNRKSLVKNLQVIGKARVPIVKFVETKSNISFDISFDVANGPDAAEFIKEAMADLPPLKPLCLVLKIFLQQRELNEVYTGGIGSYALLVMLLTHLQMHPSRRSTNSRGDPCPLESNLGILLVDFFDFYGRALNVREVGISCRNGGRFYPKAPRGFLDSNRSYLLSVEDPQSPDNDIGKNSYNVLQVRSAFLLAHRLLTKLEVEDVPAHVGLLGRIVRMDKELIRRRSTLPELPHRLNTTIKLSGQGPSGGNSSSATLQNEAKTFVTGMSRRSRWQDYEDIDFPRGGELEPQHNLSRKRKHAEEREGKGEGDEDSPNTRYQYKRKRNELGFERGDSVTGKGKTSRHRKDSVVPTSFNSPLSNPSHFHESHEQHEMERPDYSDTRAGKGKHGKQTKSRRRDQSVQEDVEGTSRTPDGKKSRWRNPNRLQKEDSHEEGEILKDDFDKSVVDNGLQRGSEVGFGAGNGYNKHKRWFNEGKSPKAGRVKSDYRARSPEVEGEGAGRPARRVVITKLAHKKIKYL